MSSGNAYTTTPHQTLPDQIAEQLRAYRAQRKGKNLSYTAALIACRDAEWGIPCLAVALDEKPTAIAQRIARGRRDPRITGAPEGFAPPPAPIPADGHPLSGKNKDRLPALPDPTGQYLRSLWQTGQERRGNMAYDDPRCANARSFDHALVHVIAAGYRPVQVARSIGASQSCVNQRLARILNPADTRPNQHETVPAVPVIMPLLAELPVIARVAA